MPLAILCRLWLAAGACAAALDYNPGPFQARVEEKRRGGGIVEYEVRFPSPLRSPFERNNTVWGHLFLPEGRQEERLPAVMVLPIMAAPNIWIEERFIRRFIREGFAVLWIEMPYQFNRRPDPSQPSGQVFLARTAGRLAANFRQSVQDGRRALEWLSRHPRIDPSRIGLFGISLGGMVGATIYSVDSRPKHAVFLLAGADFPSLTQESSMTAEFLRRAGIKPQELRQAWRGIDPLDYAAGNAGKDVLLINARSDSVVPRANGLKLKEAFPAGRQEWVSLGHYSAILHLIWMPGRVAREFKEKL
jgi:dipeptidyl aminopeptidase/acylaminoacyl peptidase